MLYEFSLVQYLYFFLSLECLKVLITHINRGSTALTEINSLAPLRFYFQVLFTVNVVLRTLDLYCSS